MTKVFGDRYEVIRPIARGGMGEVYLAMDHRLDREVAIKVLHEELSGNKAFLARFEREARAAAGLNHPNMVSVFDFGREDGSPYIVMQYVKGLTLRDLMRNQGLPPPDRAADVMAAVAGALQFAHDHGIVHRDVKPGNIMVDTDGIVKVTDFGIAARNEPGRGEDAQQLTQAGSVVGTAAYFSPEQAQGKAADARSDVYAMGCVLYELLVGRTPFDGETPWAIAYKHVNEPVPPASSIRTDVPPGLERIAMKALAKDPAERYQSAAEMRNDLLRFRRGEEPTAASTVIMAAAGAAGAPATAVQTAVPTATAAGFGYPPPRGTPLPEKRRRWPAVLGVVLLLAIAGVGVFLLVRALTGEKAATKVVPDVVGKNVNEARSLLETDGFRVEVETEKSETVPVDVVISTDPAGGKEAEVGSAVTLVVSAGADTVEVPDVVGKSEAAARSQLEDRGFEVAVDRRALDEPEGTVASMDPAGGSQAAKGSTVTITVSSGAEKVEVPDVANLKQSDAVKILQDAGFKTSVVSQESDTVAEGLVISTIPNAGTKASKGSTVTVRVSSGKSVTVLNVVGMDKADAEAQLEGLGLSVTSQPVPSPPGDAGKVVSQDPGGGSTVKKGSAVTIYVGQMGP